MTSPAIEAFRLIPDKVQALTKALADPAVQEALTLIELANQPRDSMELPVVVGLHHDSVVSRRYHEMLGVNEAIKTLRKLCSPPKQPKEYDPEPPDFYTQIDPSLIPNQ